MKGKRIVSLLLCLVMVLGLLPVSAFALEATTNKVAKATTVRLAINPTESAFAATSVNNYTGEAFGTYFSQMPMQSYYNGTATNVPKVKEAPVSGNIAQLQGTTMGNIAVKVENESDYRAKVTIYLNSNAKLDSVKLLTATAWNGFSTSADISTAVTCTKLADANAYTLTFSPDAEYQKFCRLALSISKTEQKSCTVALHYGDKTINKTYAEGEAGISLTDDELKTASAGMFEYTTVSGWYANPEFTGDAITLASYQPDLDTYKDKTIDLYAKTEIKADAKVEISFIVTLYPKQDATTVWSERYFYLPNASGEKLKKQDNHLNFTGGTIEIPVGQKLGDAYPGTGSYRDLFGETSAYLPSRGGKVNSWKYSLTGVAIDLKGKYNGQTVTADTVIPLELAVAVFEDKTAIPILADMESYMTVTFHSNLKGVTDPGTYEFTAGADLDGWDTTANQWAAEQEKKEGFNQFFRGWYFDKDCSEGKAMTNPYIPYADMDLYAKWVNPCTVTFDMNSVNVSNESAFAALTVGAGDLLTEPTARPTVVTTEANAVAFAGWYKEEACETPWDFSTDTVTENTTLYAKWNTARWLDVTFRTYGPDDLTNINPVDTTTKVPIAAGYKFGALPEFPHDEGQTNVVVGEKRTLTYTGWSYVIGGFTELLTADTDLSTKLAEGTSTLVVTAQATPSFTFTFDTNGGTPVSAQTYSGTAHTAVKPDTDPTKQDCEFVGWFADAACTKAFDFTKNHDVNTTIYAKWKEPTQYVLNFDRSAIPSAQIELKKGDTVIDPKSSTQNTVTYSLLEGTYSFTIRAAGYKALKQNEWVIDKIAAENYPYTYTVALTEFKPITQIQMSSTSLMQRESYNLNELATIEPADATTTAAIAWAAKEGTELPSGITLNGTQLSVGKDVAVGSKIRLTATVTGGALEEDEMTEKAYTQDVELTVTAYLPLISFANGTVHPDETTLPDAVRVNADYTLTEPQSPSVAGWQFHGWYKDAACSDGQVWQFTGESKDTAAEDLTLYAKWSRNPIDVTVTYAGGEGAVQNSGATTSIHKKSGDTITLQPNMFAKDGHIFRAWNDGSSTRFANTTVTLPEQSNVTYTAVWTEISEAITESDISYALAGVTEENAASYKPQLLAARDALAAGTATKQNTELLSKMEMLFKAAGLGSVSMTGSASTGVTQNYAILSTNGAVVALKIDTLSQAAHTLPEAYQNEEYKSVWRSISMTVGGATTDPKIPVIVTMPIPSELSGMAEDTLRVLLYKGAVTEPVQLTPTVSGSKLTFAFDGNGQFAIVGKEISDAADTRVTGLVMKYNGKVMGNVTQDEQGNFTVKLPATTNESTLSDLMLGTNWVTYMTVAPRAKVKPSDGAEQTAEYWANTGVMIDYTLNSSNSYSQTRTFTVTAKNGTTRDFTVTVKKITDADRTYKIAVSNISGGTVTASPSPAAAGEEVKLTVTPNDGKKLVAGSLSYCLQSAGAKSVAIDEATLTFIMPAGDININAQFEDDASAPLKNPPQITAFMINGVSAVINSDTKAITIILPYGTDLKHVAPTIVTANATKVTPSSAQRVDLSTPKAYKVYAANGAYVTYTVTAYTEEPSPTQALWGKLQNQINSNPNWWELAEYQKVNGYYK